MFSVFFLHFKQYFLCIPASAAGVAAVNPKGIKTLLAYGLITFDIKSNPVFVMDLIVYQEILPIVWS